MKLLVICLFFGIICANETEKFKRITELKNEVEELKSAMQQFLKNILVEQEGRIEDNEEDIDNLKTNVEKLEARNKDNKENFDKLKTTVGKQEERMEDNEDNFAKLKTTVGQQEARIQKNEVDFNLADVDEVKSIMRNQVATFEAYKQQIEVSICYQNHRQKKMR